MSKVYICSDLHLGHVNIQNYRTEFYSAEDHHEFVYDNLMSVVGKRDTLFLAGDVAFDMHWLDKIKSHPSRNKILILGNHDLDRSITYSQLTDVYNRIYSLHTKKGYWMSHCPIHTQEIRRREGCIHGHTHKHLVQKTDGSTTYPDPLYRNVCLEYTGYKPVLLDYVLSDEYLQECHKIWRSFNGEV